MAIRRRFTKKECLRSCALKNNCFYILINKKCMKLVFVTGGVVSSLGKGLTAASLGALLENQGLRVGLLKMDPYLNVDPGTMSPYQHGEVYVLNDGAETDLDLGHYERFTNVDLSRKNSVSSGQIYESVLKKERNGDYLGNTVQVIPHVTNEIKQRILSAASNDVDVLITEIGGVVGDIEGLPFLEALRQLSQELGRENVVFVHVTLLPYLRFASELKTKPSQQSVAKLREIGIQPDILICRTEIPMDASIREKLSLFCNVPTAAVIEEQDVETSIYELPLCLHKEHLDALVLSRLNLPYQENKPLTVWEEIVKRIKEPKYELTLGVVGKYTDLKDAYKSIYEALFHAGIANHCKLTIKTIDAEQLEATHDMAVFEGVKAILVPGGFGSRGIEGKMMAIRYARENGIPYLGICLGMQLAVVEFARHVLGYADANSTEMDTHTTHPVVAMMEEQKLSTMKGATMRLGAAICHLSENSLIRSVYNQDAISERHRHRYEFNSTYAKEFENHGMNLVGHHPGSHLVEAIEIPTHPWFIGVQYHPEFQSKPHQPHPLFVGFVKAGLEYKNKSGK